MNKLQILWSNLGLGMIQNSLEQKGEEQFLVFSNNTLSGNDIVTILNPVFSSINYFKINSIS